MSRVTEWWRRFTGETARAHALEKHYEAMLDEAQNDIDKLEKSTVSVKKYQQYRDLFPLCLMGGCGLLVAQMLLSQTIWKKLP